MADVAGSKLTTASVTVGSTTNGTLDFAGDHDWYKIALTAGQSITVTVNGVTLEDPYLYIRDSSGNLLYSDDDINPGIIRDSQLSFTAGYTGTYFIDVGAFQNSYTGDYQVVVTTYSPPPVATNDQIADQLVNGFWSWQGDTAHHFDVTQGGTITVNLSTLNPAEQALARAALAEWSDIIGVHFQEVSTGGQIVFDHNEDPQDPGPIAATDAIWSEGIISSAHVQISTSWVNTYGTSLDSYSFQTYIHEIGHALGLGHAGDYNGTATYPDDALFQNDAWSTSIMSYFSQQENSYFASQGFTDNYAVTPMVADILAMQQLYGLSTDTRSGDTSYGTFGSGIYNASTYPDVALTIYDTGGTDWLDYSSFATDQLINLNPETSSNVANGVGNLTIARGVVIENAIGGSGNDRLIGNSVDNWLEGNGGNDIIDGGGGSDTALYSDALSGVTVNLSLTGAQNTGGAGLDTLTSIENLRGSTYNDVLTGNSGDNQISGGGGDDMVNGGAGSDFVFGAAGADNVNGGDGDDIVTGGNEIDTLTGGAGNDTFSDTALGLNGDTITDFGIADRIVISDATLAGFSFSLSGNVLTYTGGSLTLSSVPAGIIVASTAADGGVELRLQQRDVAHDFNGDGRSDMLLRYDSGTLTDWLGTANGSFTDNWSVFARALSTDWQVAGIGDFNGDGRDDMLLRHSSGTLTTWLGNADGSFTDNWSVFARALSTDWQVAGTGDFNGDGRDDMLLRYSSGTLTTWLGNAEGSFTDNWSVFARALSTDWQVAGTGDFNGDGRDDMLLRYSSGTLTTWLGNANGSFTDNWSVFARALSTDWHVESQSDWLV